MDQSIDMHVHSSYSDGTCTPSELVTLACQQGLCAFALTDHDTTEGIPEAVAAGKKADIEIIPGIEFSTSYQGKDIHVLALGFDYENPRFQEELNKFRDSRDTRNAKMISLLQKEGIPISMDLLRSQYPAAVLTRAHFARFLLDNHYVRDMNEAFDRYLGDHAPCFVARQKVTPVQAISLAHLGGGYAVLAHPLLYGFSRDRLEDLVAQLKKSGLDGIEAIYSKNRWTDDSYLKQLAQKNQLKITGGSDFHGTNKPDIMLGTGRGNLKIPYTLWKELQEN